MAPSKPALAPLKTPKTVVFPSELYENPRRNAARRDDERQTPISPPLAYIEFLRTFSPVFSSPSNGNEGFSRIRFDGPRASPRASPTSIPSSKLSSSSSSSEDVKTGSTTLVSPPASGAPRSAGESTSLRRLCIPESAASASPQSVHIVRSPFSPSEWCIQRTTESPRSANGDSVSIRHVVRRTITLRHTPSLEPAPKGKRRKTSKSQSPPHNS